MTTEMRLVNDIIVTSEKLVELLILEKDYDPDVVPVIESLTDMVWKYKEKLEDMEELDNLDIE